MKTCTQCDEEKPLTEFNKRKESRDGLTPSCRRCISQRRKALDTGLVVSTVAPRLSRDQKKDVYTAVIVRMREQGLTSMHTTNEMLERVGEL